jgi:hypothetical protein
MRRELVLQIMEKWWSIIPPMGYTELVIYALMAEQANWGAVDHVGYQWRLRGDGAHKTKDPKQACVQGQMIYDLSKRIIAANLLQKCSI